MDLSSAAIAAYIAVGIPSDRIPHSPHMATLLAHIRDSGFDLDPRAAWEVLRDLRKRGLLPRVGRGRNNRVSLPPRDIVMRCYRMLGVRWDRLPYTADMDRLVALVREQTPGIVTEWQVWWALLNARKSKKTSPLGRASR